MLEFFISHCYLSYKRFLYYTIMYAYLYTCIMTTHQSPSADLLGTMGPKWPNTTGTNAQPLGH
jgi:hypothetical protein